MFSAFMHDENLGDSFFSRPLCSSSQDIIRSCHMH